MKKTDKELLKSIGEAVNILPAEKREYIEGLAAGIRLMKEKREKEGDRD